MSDRYIEGINEMQQAAWQIAEDHGWHVGWDSTKIPEKLALIHSEVSEALEAYREITGDAPIQDVYWPYEGSDKPEGLGIELADIIIRVFDLAGCLGFDMEYLINTKMKYNDTRAYRHGNKRV